MQSRQFGCFAKANDPRNIFGARAAVALVMSAMKLRLKRSSCAKIQRANSLRSIHLVRRDGKEIHTETFDVERQLSGRLYCVAVEVNVSLRRDSANFLNRLDRAELVVRMHYAYQECFRPGRPSNVLGIYDTVGTHRNVGDSDSLLFNRLSGVQDS